MRFATMIVLLAALALCACGSRSSSKSKSPNGEPNNASSNNGSNNGASNNTGSNNNTTPANNSNNATIVPPNNMTMTCTGCVRDSECFVGDSAEACGTGGEQCFACSDGWACFDGTCVEPPMCDATNCGGCCDPVRGCVTGDTESACGTGGATCSVCVNAETCDGTLCLAPCAERCFGCCDGENCLAGTADASCGDQGVDCEDCGAGSSCSAAQVCVADNCAATCLNGCCEGAVCETGTTPGACGMGGIACVDCGQGRTCMNQACVVDPASRWELVLISGVVSANNQMNEPWDIIGSPDVVVDFELFDSGTMTAYRNTSSIVQDDTTPTWNESVLTDVPASAFMEWSIDIWDSDLDFDDPICSINIDFSLDPTTFQAIFSGATYTLSCNDPNSNVFADLNVRLQR